MAMRCIFVFQSVLLLFVHPLFAVTNDAMIIGGGCETTEGQPQGEPYQGMPSWEMDVGGSNNGYSNRFRAHFALAYKALTHNDRWNVQSYYDSEEWERPHTGAQQASRENIFNALENKVSSLGQGDQFLLAIATHGSPGHSICLGKDSSGNDILVSVEELKPYLLRLKGKGVNVALLDHSCYSGKTVDDFAGSGICTMSETNPNTVGSGSAVWAATFGPGLPEGVRTEALRGGSLGAGSSLISGSSMDLDGDRTITASEAFQSARLHSTEPIIPRTSDCSLSEEGLNELLNGVTPFLSENELLGKVNSSSLIDTATGLCRVHNEFEQILRLVDSGEIVNATDELRRMGFPSESGLASFQRRKLRKPNYLLRELRRKVQRLRSKTVELARARTQAEDAINSNSPIPDSVQTELSELNNLRREIVKLVKPLIHFACRKERLSSSSEDRPCENFELFPVPRRRLSS